MVVLLLLPASGSQEGLLLWAVLASVATGMIIAVKAGGAAEWAPPSAMAGDHRRRPAGAMAGLTPGRWHALLGSAGGGCPFTLPRLPHPVGADSGHFGRPGFDLRPNGGEQGSLAVAIFTLSLALVLQQLASAAAERAGVAVLAPMPTLVGFTAAGIVASLPCPSRTPRPGICSWP